MKKFDFCIGNPPYQSTSAGEKKADDSVYNYFMDGAYQVARKVELITPARFLFENGNTPKAWNEKMLKDDHFKVAYYESDSNKVFPTLPIPIKGGIAIHYRDEQKYFGPITHFTVYPQLNSILNKVIGLDFDPITDIIFNQNKFNLDNLYKDYPNLIDEISSDGREKRLTSGCLGYDCFHDNIEKGDVRIVGYKNNQRTYKYVRREYIDSSSSNIDSYKVIVPANTGSGTFGETITPPFTEGPGTGYTQTYIGFGIFKTKQEALNLEKYIKTKFLRTMLGIVKVTQNGKKDMYKYVPLQSFGTEGDIDWSVPVKAIDKQLYKKYNLTSEEIEFIETHVKEME